MLSEISIRNFAIIDDLNVSFNNGLSVLTGETGAGKSIIIDAVQLLIGGRASVDYIRHGKEKAEISGLFFVDKISEKMNAFCEEYQIEIDNNELILERTITTSAKNICRINGKIVTLTLLRQLGQMLINIHSQHDTTHLLNCQMHLSLLDAYNAKQIKPLQLAYEAQYKTYRKLTKKFTELSTNEQQLAHRIDLLEFQINELEQANLTVDEDETLESERTKLQNYERVFQSVQEAYYAITNEQRGLDSIKTAQMALQESSKHDEELIKHEEIITNVFYNLEDVGHELRQYLEQLHFDEGRLNEVEDRLNEINRLKKKYGSTVAEMIEYLQTIKAELGEISNKETSLEKLSLEINEAKKTALITANKLSKLRQKTAKQLEIAIKTELKDLYLENASLTVDFIKNDDLTETGTDTVTFLLATNLGEPAKELSKIASGGELSRIMLALKKIFAKHDNILTVVFDEIDTGVSGRVAQAIARKMYEISLSTQVLTITHLPQVAAMADTHLSIEKVEQDNRTTTSVTQLTDSAKIKELAKMITGATLTDSALEHSEALFQLSEQYKETF